MSFDWKSLGGLLAKQGLPILANAIIPGSGTVVALITNALGLSHDASPQDIATAINSNPDNIVKLKELQDKHEEAIVQISTAAEVAAIQAVNTTCKQMQEEIAGFRRIIMQSSRSLLLICRLYLFYSSST